MAELHEGTDAFFFSMLGVFFSFSFFFFWFTIYFAKIIDWRLSVCVFVCCARMCVSALATELVKALVQNEWSGA